KIRSTPRRSSRAARVNVSSWTIKLSTSSQARLQRFEQDPSMLKEFPTNREVTLVCAPSRPELVNCECRFPFADVQHLLAFWRRLEECALISQLFCCPSAASHRGDGFALPQGHARPQQ